jgi:hypothetical protein
MNEKAMPKCPGCGKVWYWDWLDDVYRQKDGTLCVVEDTQEKILYSCTCRYSLGSMVFDGEIISPSEWKGVDWNNEWNYS